ncbi:coenzyme A pyrophosphatase [Halioglobus sp. HI00S01]|uniref:NUDIX hydrolase n=1 Tax=Halioglobus sp. HI00S01 TaxID=1822214 RepID=UPI0007C335E7|nr:CoA pyrophosphatase [Halioglobus sp. HI00S01]KZX60532.1 coenzyme A pyrophosphatase [Halioglobus sp. HI00S01]
MQALQNFQFTLRNRLQIVENLDLFKSDEVGHTQAKRAAVAVTIIRNHAESVVVITRRSSALRAHGGQWALPGGKIDQGESVVEAALRELYEEVNVSLDESSVLGTLDDYTTRSGYLITPVVIWADIDWDAMSPNPDEVESIHPFTFSELARPESPYLETIPESTAQVLSMHYERDRIYAPTGAILYQFREVGILGRPTRVAHFEQPVFAWR